MQKKTAVAHPVSAPDAFPDKLELVFILRRRALSDPKLSHGAARVFCLLLDWSYLRNKGGDGHFSISVSSRKVAEAIGACRDFVRVWLAGLVRRKYLERTLVDSGLGPKIWRFGIVGLCTPALGLESGPSEPDGTLGLEVGPRHGPSSRPKGGPSSRPKVGPHIITVETRETKETQKGSSSGTERIFKTAETDKPLKGSSAFRLQRCEAPGKKPKGKPAIDSEAEAEFLELIERNAGRNQVEQWGGWWRNEFRKFPDRWSRIWLEIDSMRREGNPPKRPAHYAKKMFKIFA